MQVPGFCPQGTQVHRNSAVNTEPTTPAKVVKPSLPTTERETFSQPLKCRRINKQEECQHSGLSVRKQALSIFFDRLDKIDNPDLLRYIILHKVKSSEWIVQHTATELFEQVVTADFLRKNKISSIKFDVTQLPASSISEDLALYCLNLGEYEYPKLPEKFKTVDFQMKCLERDSPFILKYIPDQYVSSMDYEKMVRKRSMNLEHVPYEKKSYSLCKAAVCDFGWTIAYVPTDLPQYKDLCLIALRSDPQAITTIPDDQVTDVMADLAVSKSPAAAPMALPSRFRTAERCRLAIMNRGNTPFRDFPSELFFDSPDLIKTDLFWNQLMAFLPDSLKTEANCLEFLKNTGSIKGIPASFLKKNPDWLLSAVEQSAFALEVIPKELITPELCKRSVSCYGESLRDVPLEIIQQNPDLIQTAARQGYISVFVEKFYDIPTYGLAVTVNPKAIRSVPEKLKAQLPARVLLNAAPQYLTRQQIDLMISTGETSSLLLPPVNFRKQTSSQLLKPLPPLEIGHLDASVILKDTLMTCGPFQLRDAVLGKKLGTFCQEHIARQKQALELAHLSCLDSVGDDWIAYGGRTLLQETQGKCRRLKFLRKGEPLDVFFQEQATHLFASQHENQIRLRSEIPEAVGIKLLPVDRLSAKLQARMTSVPEIVEIDEQRYFVVYEFKTDNLDYSTLAHSKADDGSSHMAEAGMIKTSYDLGRWSSLGAVHTSTYKALHGLQLERQELFTVYLFNNQHAVPGSLHGALGSAIAESDWSYSGLKDLGDFERYPEINSYFDTRDAETMLPGYDQRCAFINGFCENMMAAVLHYARLHRDENDYHYKNERAVKKLEGFMEECLEAYLEGLLGQKIQLHSLFDSKADYRIWQTGMAKETLLWTAIQGQEKDCFARELNQNKRLPEDVYPGTQNCFYNHPEDFMFDGEEKLGINNEPFPMTMLIRGLYHIAGELAQKLTKP